jgi:hypothetical protein
VNARSLFGLRVLLTLIVLAGLAIDAYVHFDLAAGYDGVKSDWLSEGDFFRIEGSIAILAAVALLVRPRRYTALFAFLVTAGGLAAVVVFRYVDLGAHGPLPEFYEPVWYGEKTFSAWAEGIAAVAAAGLIAVISAPAPQRARRGLAPSAPLAH